MYVRAKTVRHRDTTYEYLQLVEARREAGRNRQRAIATLGRLDQIAASGQLDQLIAGLARFSQHLRVVSVDRADGFAARTAKSWGPALVFGRLWGRQGLPGILERLTARPPSFDVERVAFALALQRLVAPGSDRQGAGWLETIEAPGLATVRRHQMYRTVAALAELRGELERELFLADRDLFSGGLDLVCIDTTSTYVYREHEHDGSLRRRGYSRDKRPDLPQVVVCLAVDRHGWPVAWEIFPGNTADRPALEAMVAKMRERLRIGRVCVVADRGMIARDILAYLTTGHHTPWDYILGCRLRTDKAVREDVLADPRPFRRLADGLEVKDVRRGERRYVVCRNPIEAERDARMRDGSVDRLRATLRHGPKAVVGNRGFARFLTMDKGALAIDAAAIEADARFDGVFVLRTNTDQPADEVARLYKGLWRVERAFREVKTTLEVRPIYHQNDEACVGHLVAGFLALRLEVDLQRRLDAAGVTTPWPDLMRDLAQVQAVVVDLDGQRYRLRTDLQGAAHAAGVRPPNSVTCLGPIPAAEPRIRSAKDRFAPRTALVQNAS